MFTENSPDIFLLIIYVFCLYENVIIKLEETHCKTELQKCHLSTSGSIAPKSLFFLLVLVGFISGF